MKKLMTLILGAGLAFGVVSMYGQDSTTKTKSTTTTKTSKGKTKSTTVTKSTKTKTEKTPKKDGGN
jgi:hypothetical protein